MSLPYCRSSSLPPPVSKTRQPYFDRAYAATSAKRSAGQLRKFRLRWLLQGLMATVG